MLQTRLTGLVMDWTEAMADKLDDPESRPAGVTEPHYAVSDKVTISRDHGLYVYHVADDQLGQGSSLGNTRVWAETKGNGDMLNLYSVEASRRVMGGMSVTYLMPFNDVSVHETGGASHKAHLKRTLNRAIPSSVGAIHLHPAFQQRELVIGDGLHVLETFFVPRLQDSDDPAAAYEIVSLWNRTPHPIEITIVGSLAFRGHTDMDICAAYDSSRNALVAWNKSNPQWVRLFGSLDSPEHYCAIHDKDRAYNPKQPLRDEVSDVGDSFGSLQFNVFLYPGARKKIRMVAAFSPDGRQQAQTEFDRAAHESNALKQTIQYYGDVLSRSVVEMPDDMLTHAVHWAKACLARPICDFKVGRAFTNDPGNSSNIVGRDAAWYVHGTDFLNPEWSCSMLSILADFQREDGLIREYIDGNTGKSEDYGFNINDDTPLFIMALEHHVASSAHWDCLEKLYPAALKAGELILSQRDEHGLVKCDATGIGPTAICSWRNVLENQAISGVVTEVNSECFAALRSLGNLAEMMQKRDDAERYRREADTLREHINQHLVNQENGLYVLNIAPSGNVYTQVTGDMVFPLICGVAEPGVDDSVIARLAESDFMTDAGIRVVPSEDPEYDPSFESGCMGGVWQGVTWWYAMAAAGSDPTIMATSLRRAYSHYVTDPRVYNTVPGQFSEWSDGQTLVNRGMRLSPWDSPRFLWAAIEGLAGIKMKINGINLEPHIPPEWQWLRLHRLLYRDGMLSYFMVRQRGQLHVYTPNRFDGDVELHLYDKEAEHAPEGIASGITSSAFVKDGETLICFGSSLDIPTMGPFLTHHSIESGRRYRVMVLASHHDDWIDLGTHKGSELQRMAVRIGKRGYALYRFIEA